MSTYVTYAHMNGPVNVRFRDFAGNEPAWARDIRPDGDDPYKAALVEGVEKTPIMTAQEMKEFEEDIARGEVPWYRKAK